MASRLAEYLLVPRTETTMEISSDHKLAKDSVLWWVPRSALCSIEHRQCPHRHPHRHHNQCHSIALRTPSESGRSLQRAHCFGALPKSSWSRPHRMECHQSTANHHALCRCNLTRSNSYKPHRTSSTRHCSPFHCASTPILVLVGCTIVALQATTFPMDSS